MSLSTPAAETEDVVASEVRALAQRSSEAAREINDLIAQSGTQVREGVDLVGKTGHALEGIVGSVTEIADRVSEIAESARQQSSSLEEINSSVTKLDQSTQQNTARLEETTAASDALRADAATLVSTIDRFRLTSRKTEAAPSHPPAQARKAAPVAAKGGAAPAEVWTDF